MNLSLPGIQTFNAEIYQAAILQIKLVCNGNFKLIKSKIYCRFVSII